MKPDVLSDVILTIMQQRLKKHFTMHCFRASAASFVADVAPERARIATKTLDHERFSTTAKYYIRSQQRNALRLYHVVVKASMQKGRRKRPRRS